MANASPHASRCGWTPRTRCSSCTPPAPPASPRACSTPPAATWSTPPSPSSTSSTSRTRTSTGAPPTAAGSPGTATSSTDRLSNGATQIVFEGIPTYPQMDRFWKIVEKFKVNIFYTAPTAIRSLMREGEKWPNKHDLSSLRVLGTVGEPINPEAWIWYHKNIGHETLPDRGHLVADRDRRHPDHAAARRHDHQARFRHAAVLRHRARHREGGRYAGRSQRGRLSGHQEALARHHEDRLRSARALHRDLLVPLARPLLHRRLGADGP